MKKNYIKPLSCPVDVVPGYVLMASAEIDASGQDYNDPYPLTQGEFDDIFS